ncbi:MAG: tetratricopeptide repeat protein [Candidatus Aquirickettsiella gammari]
MFEKTKFIALLIGGCCVFNAHATPQQQEHAPPDTASSINIHTATNTDVQANAAVFPEVKALIAQDKIPQAIELLTSLLSTYENDPDYFYLLGDLYFRQKAFAQAAAAYERVVLIQSGNAGAWMDLAIANSEAGNFPLAEQYFDYILANLRPSAKIVGIIDNYRTRIKTRAFQAKPWHFQVDYAYGYDSNANSGLVDKSIYINIDGKPQKIDLDTAYIARSDSFRNLFLQSRYQGKIGEQDLFWNVSLANHTLKNEHAFSITDLSTGLGLSHRGNLFDVGINLNAERLWLSGSTLLNNGNLGFFAAKSWQHCDTNLVLETEKRRYVVPQVKSSSTNATNNAAVASLDANILWQNLANSCGFSTNWGFFQQTLILRHGNDKPNTTRVGGQTHRNEVIGKLTWRAPNATQLDFSLNLARARDVEGYSALLENNAARLVLRRIYRLQFQYPLADNWFLFLNLEKNTNYSNLSIFRQAGKSANAGLRKIF